MESGAELKVLSFKQVCGDAVWSVDGVGRVGGLPVLLLDARVGFQEMWPVYKLRKVQRDKQVQVGCDMWISRVKERRIRRFDI